MNAIALAHQADAYAGLLQQVRNDLRVQHPEWIQPNGQCPACDSYEARLIELLSIPGGQKVSAQLATGACGLDLNR